MIFAPTNRRIIRPGDKPSFEHTQRYGLIKGHWANTNRVGLWLFNEGSGGQVRDLSGNGYNGTFVGDPIWVAGIIGPAIDFSDDAIDCGDNVYNQCTTALTIVFKGTPGSGGYSSGRIVDKYPGPSIYRYTTDSTMRFYGTIGGVSKDLLWPGSSWAVGETATWAFVLGPSIQMCYKNGVLVSNALSGGPYPGVYDDGGAVNFYIGNRVDMARDFDGLIEYVYIYNRVLINAKIAQLTWNPFLGIEKRTAPVYFFVPTGGVVYQELNLTVTADASAAETDTHTMVDTGKAVQADAAVTESDTQQMVETGKEVSADASVSCTDLKVVFELNLTVNAAGSVVATEAHTMIETGKVVTAVASPAVIDTQTMLETGLGVSAEGSVSCTDTMVLLAHIAAFMILRQCTT